jgi:hypothetical protein|tara:strand:+ start:1237 stop:1449 length:213 start_codon:yes stop_codon:yes gene_type:complete
MKVKRHYDRDLYINVLEAEVKALKTRLDHVMNWSYREQSRKDLCPETVDLMITKYITANESQRDLIPEEL